MSLSKYTVMTSAPRAPTMRMTDVYSRSGALPANRIVTTPSLSLGTERQGRRIYAVVAYDSTQTGSDLDSMMIGATPMQLIAVLGAISGNLIIGVYGLDWPTGEASTFEVTFNGSSAAVLGPVIGIYRGYGYALADEVSATGISGSGATTSAAMNGVTAGAAMLVAAATSGASVTDISLDDTNGLTPFRQDTGALLINTGAPVVLGSYDTLSAGNYSPRATANAANAGNFSILAVSIPRA